MGIIGGGHHSQNSIISYNLYVLLKWIIIIPWHTTCHIIEKNPKTRKCALCDGTTKYCCAVIFCHIDSINSFAPYKRSDGLGIMPLMRMLVIRQTMPLLMKIVGKSNAIFPLFQSSPLAAVANQQRSKKIVTFPNVLVPNGQNDRLFVQFTGSCLKTELLVEDGIQISPFHAGLIFLISMRVWL